MKRIFLAIALISAGTIVNAQAKFGVKGGLNLSTFSGKDVEDAKIKPGFHLGGFVNLAVSESFSVQPEVLFSTQGAKSSAEEVSVSLNTSYVNIPVMAQYNNASGFYAETGPLVGFLLGAKMKAEGESMDVKDWYKSLDFGWGIGLGYKLPSGLGFGARYNLGLAKVFEEGDSKVSNSVIQVGLSFAFGGK